MYSAVTNDDAVTNELCVIRAPYPLIIIPVRTRSIEKNASINKLGTILFMGT